MASGWIRYPTLAQDTIVFTCDDDLWSVPASGGLARRLTTGLGTCARPRLDADASRVAFDGSEEGVREVYLVDADGGPVRRLTHDGAGSRVLGWSPDGEVLFTSARGRPFARDSHLYALEPEGGAPRRLPWGPAEGVAFGPDGQVALCRHQHDLAWWKGYRGGRTGQLWVRTGSEPFRHLAVPGNVAAPQWVGERLVFVADVEGDPQLWSIDADGNDLQRHTAHDDLAVRFPSSDGARVVYTYGGDLWLWRPGSDPEQVDVELKSQRTWRQRRFPSPVKYLEEHDLHPDAHSLALIVRGRPFVMGNWEGPVRQLGLRDGSRYRLLRWIDAERLLCTCDEGGEEQLVILTEDGAKATPLTGLPVGRAVSIEVDPTGRRAAIADHRNDLYAVDLDSGEARLLDHSHRGVLTGLSWSRDGRWLVWSRPEAVWGSRASIQLCDVADGGERIAVTDGSYRDHSPSFDPDGEHLYLLSAREFDPVSDAQHFAYGFPRGTRPYVITLRHDVEHPFQPRPAPLKRPRATTAQDAVRIDIDGLADRLVPFPVAEGRYDEVIGVGHGKVLLVRSAVRGTLDRSWFDPGPPKVDSDLLQWEFDKRELTLVSPRISSVRPDRKRDHLIVRQGWKVRVIPARPDRGQRDEIKKSDGAAGRKSMWIQLDRIRVSVDPGAEWRQMLVEAWRLMRDHYWRPSLQGVDWEAIRERYLGLVDRVASRAELSDLVWCMQGELKTSHAYEMGGDHRPVPSYRVGRLGADLSWDESQGGWRVDAVVRGEPGDRMRSSPLVAPGAGIRAGDVLVAVGGVAAKADESVDLALVHQAGLLVELEVRTPSGTRTVVVQPLKDEQPLRYREWVLQNRRWVHEATAGRVGYVHVPDMGPSGFAEFHRDFHAESERGALIVDVRWNRGGHVSQLLLDHLSRPRLGYKVPRWGRPAPYPASSVDGPMICLTNEMAGSDGDIFSHAWKLMGLGPLVGTRTWGGVVGISPRSRLVDRAVTTQPEFSTWFSDVGYGLENHGTDPDEVVPFPPDAWETGTDPQLERAVAMITATLQAHPTEVPDLS